MDINKSKIISPYQERAQEVLKSTFIEYGQNLKQHIEELSNIYYIDTDYLDKKYSDSLILAIGETNMPISTRIDQYYNDIISIGKLEINIVQKWHVLEILKKSLMNYINKHKFEINFKYSDLVLRDLNEIVDYNYSWMDNNHVHVLKTALEAYRDIEYFNMWIKKHNITKKDFVPQRDKLIRDITHIQKYTNTNILVDIKIPDHPQDIIHKLGYAYLEFYGEDVNLFDAGVSNIITIISDYTSPAKKSKSWKEKERLQSQFHVNTNKISEKDFFNKLIKMIEKKIPDKEVKNFISEFTHSLLEIKLNKS